MNGQKQYREDLLEWCHETSKSLCEQLELLYRESNASQKRLKSILKIVSKWKNNSNARKNIWKQMLFKTRWRLNLTNISIRRNLTNTDWIYWNWCNILYSNWNRTKLRLSNIVDNESLEGWEGMCSRLKEKLQEGLSLDYKDYETANTLYEQWERFLEESYSDRVDREVRPWVDRGGTVLMVFFIPP